VLTRYARQRNPCSQAHIIAAVFGLRLLVW
jgi:hypothetical protein